MTDKKKRKKRVMVDEQKIMELWNQGIPRLEIAEKLNYSHTAVCRCLKRNGFWERNRNPFPNQIKSEIIQKYKEGKTGEELIDEYGIGHGTMYRMLRVTGTIRSSSEALRKYTLNQDAFADAENNPEAAYWVGFLMADGSVGIRDSGQHTVSLALCDIDYDHVVKFQKFVKTENPVRIEKNSPGYKEGTKLAALKMTSQKMVEDLSKHGVVPRKSLIAEVKLLENDPNFWRGCVDGDGYVTFLNSYPKVGLVGSKLLVSQFCMFVDKVTKWKRKATVVKCGTIWATTIAGRRAMQLLDVLYKDSKIFLERKWKIAQECKNWSSKVPDRSDFPLERLEELKWRFGNWEEVAKFIGTSASAVATRYSRLKRKTNL